MFSVCSFEVFSPALPMLWMSYYGLLHSAPAVNYGNAPGKTAPRDFERMEGDSILITKPDGTWILYTRNITYSCTSEVYRSFSSTISFMSAASFNRANHSKSVSGTKFKIPARTSCGYQGTTTRRPHPSDLTTTFAKSSAEGLRREDLPPSPPERTSPTFKYENQTLEPWSGRSSA